MVSDKALFSLDDHVHYLNCAYKAPLLKSAEFKAIDILTRNRNPQNIKPTDFFDHMAVAQSLFGNLIGADAESIALVPSVSYGFASALKNIQYKPGQHALTVQDEFPSGYLSLKRWCENHGAALNVISIEHNVQMGQMLNERILSNITSSTAVVLISSVHWMNGIKFDLEAIGKKCRDVGAKLLVDGTQSVGALPMDVHTFGIDALICAGYKWLLGPYSIGLAYYGDVFDQGIPIEESWMNRSNAHDFAGLTNYSTEYLPKAARYNVGETSHFIQLPMLNEGLKQVTEWNPASVQAYAGELIEPLLNRQTSIGLAIESTDWRCNHLFALPLPLGMNPLKVSEALVAANVFVSVRGSSLRISVNRFNDAADIQALMDALDELNL